MMANASADWILCSPEQIICPRCKKILPRQHTGPGWRTDFCDRSIPQGTESSGKPRFVACNTHLFISRGKGDRHVIVAALDSEAHRQKLIETIEGWE